AGWVGVGAADGRCCAGRRRCGARAGPGEGCDGPGEGCDGPGRTADEWRSATSMYDFHARDIDGHDVALERYRYAGRVVLSR
uniref:Uncharacterized protein n=1 Tax=Phasianus colchicus TaxID=9054 RepID=A0A669QMH6_PHACC